MPKDQAPRPSSRPSGRSWRAGSARTASLRERRGGCRGSRVRAIRARRMSASTESALAAEEAVAGAFRRILLKLSGEALMGDRDFGIDLPTVESLAREILDVHDAGVEVAIVIGG